MKILIRFIAAITWLKQQVREFPEIFGLPIIFFTTMMSYQLLLSVDNTAATWDIGVIQTPIIAGVIVLLVNLMVFLGFKLNFPTLYKEYLKLKFDKLSQWEKFLACLLPILLYSLEFLIIMGQLI